jgi:integrase
VAVKVDGKRRYIHMGEGVERKDARKFADYSQRLADHPTRNLSEMPKDLRGWVEDLKSDYHAKLAKAGLVESREPETRKVIPTLADFTDQYIKGRADAKPRTIINLKQARTDLIAYFKDGQRLDEITPGDADDFYRWMLGTREPALSANTAKRIAGRAKQFYQAAIRRRLVTENPFADLKSHVTGSPERFYFVDRDTFDKVLAEETDPEFRAILALARYGGLRCPTEVLALKWSDIDWLKNRITVHVPKLAHVEGKGVRVIPLFPELRPYLRAAFEAAPEGGTPYVVAKRDTEVNWRTRLGRRIKDAGLTPWPKMFQNLRSTRETELAETYPLHVVCKWIGNSAAIAREHYLQLRDEHFDKATAEAVTAAPVAKAEQAEAEEAEQDAVTVGADVAQGRDAQHVAQHINPETFGGTRNHPKKNPEKSLVSPGNSGGCQFSQPNKVPPRGAEQPAISNGETTNSDSCATRGATLPADLAEVVAAWPKLAAGNRANIVELVRALTAKP